jgi:eukaryotic-like serine/threonine-protein kinase
MVTPAGLVKLLDFGLVKLTSSWAGPEMTGPRTVAGAVVGTVCYMSPEQALSQPLDPRSDIFSLGTVLYEKTGKRAFGNASPMLSLTAVLRDVPAEQVETRPFLPN